MVDCQGPESSSNWERNNNGIYFDQFAFRIPEIETCIYDKNKMIQKRQNEIEASADSTPSLCVILFCHNQADYLPMHAEVITSCADIIDQILLVDIASDIPVEPLAKKLFGEVEGLQVHRYNENVGIFYAMSDMFQSVKTEFVHFLAIDDYVEPAFYRSCRKMTSDNPGAGIFSTAYSTVNEDGASRQPFRLAYPSATCVYLTPTQTKSAVLRNDAWFAGHATVFNVRALRALNGFDISLQGFSDAYAIYSLAFTEGVLFDPGLLATKRLHSNHEGTRFYDKETGSALLEKILLKMNASPSVFGPTFRHRFAGRWRYNSAILALESGSQNKVSWITKILRKLIALVRHKPFDLPAIIRKNCQNRSF